MKAIVTGSTGFIGSALAKRLVADGWNVVGLDRRASGDSSAYEFRQFEIASGRSPIGGHFDVVFHLAATPGVMTSVDDPAGAYANNLSSTAGALELARKCGAHRFIFASSSTVYGNAAAVTEGPVGESSPLNPLNAYAASKIACEKSVYDMAKFAGLDFTVLRLFSVYGPGMRSDLAMSKMAKCAADGTSFTMRGDGTTRRDYTYIDDVVEAFALAATEPKADCMTFNICGRSPVSLCDTIAAVEKAMDAKVHVKQCDETPYDAVATYGDNTLAVEKLGWRPKVGFDEGVTRFSEWFKERSKTDEQELRQGRFRPQHHIRP